MKVNIITATDGSGYWSDRKKEGIIINELYLWADEYDLGEDPCMSINELVKSVTGKEVEENIDTFEKFDAALNGNSLGGELRACFTNWNVDRDGLIYTDKLWMKTFVEGLKNIGIIVPDKNLPDYSEQGMQSECIDRKDGGYVSMDVDNYFIYNWLCYRNNIPCT